MNSRRSSGGNASVATTITDSRSPSFCFFSSPSNSPYQKKKKPAVFFLPPLDLAAPKPKSAKSSAQESTPVVKRSSLAQPPLDEPNPKVKRFSEKSKRKIHFINSKKSAAEIQQEIYDHLLGSQAATIQLIASKQKTLFNALLIYDLHKKFYFSICEDDFLSRRKRGADAKERLKRMEETEIWVQSLRDEIKYAEQDLVQINQRLVQKASECKPESQVYTPAIG
ncbi:MAG: hypothetical protein P4M14_06555 [Gammaproteobacteria bacterium]|nr:hypothetical protein [Gammaproteobacteria bacterium]